MNFRELINLTSLELNLAGAGDKAIEPVMVSYLNLGYKIFVEEMGNKDDVLDFDLAEGESEITLPAYVLKIKSATLDNTELGIINRDDKVRLGLTEESPTKYLCLGDTPATATLYGKMKVAGTLHLGILRGPLRALSADSDRPSDISEKNQLGIVEWAVWRLTKDDSRLAAFSAMVDDERARNNKLRSKPARTVAYGGL